MPSVTGGPPEPSWTSAYRTACAALATTNGWATRFGDLPCHPGCPTLAYRVTGAELQVCLVCLQGFMQANGLLIGPNAPTPTRTCQECSKRLPMGDFMSRAGTLTSFCPDCRNAWVVKKKAAEAAEIKAAWDEAATTGRGRIESQLTD